MLLGYAGIYLFFFTIQKLIYNSSTKPNIVLDLNIHHINIFEFIITKCSPEHAEELIFIFWETALIIANISLTDTSSFCRRIMKLIEEFLSANK